MKIVPGKSKISRKKSSKPINGELEEMRGLEKRQKLSIGEWGRVFGNQEYTLNGSTLLTDKRESILNHNNCRNSNNCNRKFQEPKRPKERDTNKTLPLKSNPGW